MLRLFNGRGSVSVRDRSVTGLHTLLFPPISAGAKFGLVHDYRFQLAFHEGGSGVLIQDVVQDAYEHMMLTGKGPHPLGLNFWPGTPFVMQKTTMAFLAFMSACGGLGVNAPV